MTDPALSSQVFPFFLVFVRVGAAMMIMPGVGDGFVSPRVRLFIALTLTAVVTPAVMAGLPEAPANVTALSLVIAGETIIGTFLGLVARIMVAAVDVAGMIISFSMSFANAFVFNPALEAQGSMISNFLGILALTLIYLGDLHHLLILAVADSYTLFIPGQVPPGGDMAEMISRLVADAFALGLRMAAPFVTLGLVFYLGLGVLARLMPQVQVFFVAMPMNIMLGLIVMTLVLSGAMTFWLQEFQDVLIGFLRNG